MVHRVFLFQRTPIWADDGLIKSTCSVNTAQLVPQNLEIGDLNPHPPDLSQSVLMLQVLVPFSTPRVRDRPSHQTHRPTVGDRTHPAIELASLCADLNFLSATERPFCMRSAWVNGWKRQAEVKERERRVPTLSIFQQQSLNAFPIDPSEPLKLHCPPLFGNFLPTSCF